MTGLIYVAIIALWAAVLIPIWLKRHDQVSEVRSTARFSSAMKSLGDRGVAEEKARRESHRESHRESQPGESNMGSRNSQSGRSHASAVAAKRRTMVLGALTGLVFLALVGSILGFVPIAIPVVFAVLLGAFVVASAMTSSQRKSTSTNSPRLESVPARAEDARRTKRAEPMPAQERAESQMSELDEFAAWDPWEEDDSWDAVPQTLPSYVSAPRATAVPRNIERDGDWSGESMMEAARTMQRPAVNAENLVRNPVANYADSTAEIPIIRANAPYQARAVNE